MAAILAAILNFVSIFLHQYFIQYKGDIVANEKMYTFIYF